MTDNKMVSPAECRSQKGRDSERTTEKENV
nr:MAG TPA: hypothetical protein [Caudoviricetes sp.]